MSLPRANADIRLNTHDSLLVKKGMGLADDLVDAVPGTFYTQHGAEVSEPNPSFRTEIMDLGAYQGLCRLNAGCISRLMPRSIVGRQRSGQRLRPKQCRSGRIIRTNFNGGIKLSYHTGIRQKSAVHFGGVGRSMMLEWSSLRVVVIDLP